MTFSDAPAPNIAPRRGTTALAFIAPPPMPDLTDDPNDLLDDLGSD